MAAFKMLGRILQTQAHKPGNAASFPPGRLPVHCSPCRSEHAWAAGSKKRRAWQHSAGRSTPAETETSLRDVEDIALEVERLRQENDRLLAELSAAEQHEINATEEGAGTGDLATRSSCVALLWLVFSYRQPQEACAGLL